MSGRGSVAKTDILVLVLVLVLVLASLQNHLFVLVLVLENKYRTQLCNCLLAHFTSKLASTRGTRR